jgi:hypothetical protein
VRATPAPRPGDQIIIKQKLALYLSIAAAFIVS